MVLTDCNDLDDQHFGQFQLSADTLAQAPVQARGLQHLNELLNLASIAAVFTTINNFMPGEGEAIPRRNARLKIAVITDEVHRGQYGFGVKVNGVSAQPSCSGGGVSHGKPKYSNSALDRS